MKMRMEHDLLGDMEIPADAWYGIQTQRALDNFSITGVPISHFPQLVNALAMVKAAAAKANTELGLLRAAKADAIVAACEQICAGHLHDQFVVDLIQGGAGTSTNMNANEVIANLALEKLGHRKGDGVRRRGEDGTYPTAGRRADDPGPGVRGVCRHPE